MFASKRAPMKIFHTRNDPKNSTTQDAVLELVISQLSDKNEPIVCNCGVCDNLFHTVASQLLLF